MSNFKIEFCPSGRGKAQCPSNPRYPEGVVMDVSSGEPTCTVDLPYPAPECGYWDMSCQMCGMTLAVTAAGRPDDPRRITVSCEKVKFN